MDTICSKKNFLIKKYGALFYTQCSLQFKQNDYPKIQNFDNYQITLTETQYKDLHKLFKRVDLSPIEVSLRIMDIVKISKTRLKNYPWKGIEFYKHTIT